MIRTREAWLRWKDRERLASSAGIAAALFAGVFIGLFLFDLLAVKDLSNVSGPILIRLGAPEGLDDSPFTHTQPKDLPPEEPEEEPEVAQDEPPPPDELKAPDPLNESTLVMQRPSPAPSKKPSPAPTKRPSPAPSRKPSPAPTRKSAPSPSAALAKASPVPSARPASSPVPLSIKGSEAGNSHETSFGSAAGEVSRSLYAPIYLYLPLPRSVEPIIQMSIRDSKVGLYSKAEQLQEFERWYYYDSTDLNYKLREQPPMDDRPRLWIILEEARYPMKTADYKAGRSLSPVVIEFTVASRDKYASLESSKLSKSSGYADIDQAVLFGFRKAAFSNSTDRSIRGRFTYNF